MLVTMVINKIDIKQTEEILMIISEESIKLKILQEELEGINISLRDIDAGIKLGKISKKIYNEFKSNLEEEKRILETKVKKTIERILINSKKLYNVISNCKI
jgi:hypothetical protein